MTTTVDPKHLQMYVQEKVNLAVNRLTLGKEDIRGRLANAYDQLARLMERDFDGVLAPIRDDVAEIRKSLKRDDGSRLRFGGVHGPLNEMSDTEAIRIADDICGLKAKTAELLAARTELETGEAR